MGPGSSESNCYFVTTFFVADTSSDGDEENDAIMALSTVNKLEYRAAVALNNMAVAMMERSCYEQAFETIKDAALTMQLLYTIEPLVRSSMISSEQTPYQHDIQTKLQRAYHRAANPVLSAISSKVRVVSDDAAFNSANIGLKGLQTLSGSSHRMKQTAILISSDHLGLLDRQDFALTISIILFNVSTASQCFALNIGSGILAIMLHREAMNLLLACRDILDVLLLENMGNLISMQQVVFIASFVLKALVQALRMCGRTAEIQLTIMALDDLCHVATWSESDISQMIFEASGALAPAA